PGAGPHRDAALLVAGIVARPEPPPASGAAQLRVLLFRRLPQRWGGVQRRTRDADVSQSLDEPDRRGLLPPGAAPIRAEPGLPAPGARYPDRIGGAEGAAQRARTPACVSPCGRRRFAGALPLVAMDVSRMFGRCKSSVDHTLGVV